MTLVRRRMHRLAWLPAFTLGLAAAVSAETSAALLLYSGGGFLRALTLVLAAMLGALAVGLASVSASDLADPVEAVGRRWRFTVAVYALATAAAAGWSVMGGLVTGPVARGVGLALLAALPLYATGNLLGALSLVRGARGYRGPGASAAAGAAFGATFTGFFLVRAVAPMSMYVFSLLALSVGGLVQGRVLGRLLEEDRIPLVDVELLRPDAVEGAPREGGAGGEEEPGGRAGP